MTSGGLHLLLWLQLQQHASPSWSGLNIHHGHCLVCKLIRRTSWSGKHLVELSWLLTDAAKYLCLCLTPPRESIDAHDSDSCYGFPGLTNTTPTVPPHEFDPVFPPPEDFNGFGEGNMYQSYFQFFSTIQVWYVHLYCPSYPFQPSPSSCLPLPGLRAFRHTRHHPIPIPTPLNLFHCSQTWRTGDSSPELSSLPFVVLHFSKLIIPVPAHQPWTHILDLSLVGPLCSNDSCWLLWAGRDGKVGHTRGNDSDTGKCDKLE